MCVWFCLPEIKYSNDTETDLIRFFLLDNLKREKEKQTMASIYSLKNNQIINNL